MKNLISIVLTTLFFTASFAATARAEIATQAFPGYDAPGNDFDSFPSGNQRNCEVSCKERTNCFAASFVPSTGRCWLKSGFPQNTRDPKSVLIIKILAGRDGVDYPGGDYKSFQRATWQSCSRACFVDTQCKAFAWDKNDHTCWLKNAVIDASFASNSIAGKR